MRKIILIATLFVATTLGVGVRAQSNESTQLILNVEKLAQFRQILSDMKTGYQILNGGYNTIKDLSQGNFSLHQTFLDGLMQVSPEVRNYRKVAEIIGFQLRLVNEYRTAWRKFSFGGLFRPDELEYIAGVYDRLFNGSLKNLDELTMIVTAGQLRMSDNERLEAIDRIYTDMEDKLNFLRSFNNGTAILAVQRERERKEIRTLEAINGLEAK